MLDHLRAFHAGDPYPPITEDLEGQSATKFLVLSFGYLHGPLTRDPHSTLDLRKILHNPLHDLEMREKTGLEPEVQRHVMATPGVDEIVETQVAAAVALYRHLDPQNLMTILAIGCSGGRHRSVVIANRVARALHRLTDETVAIEHRDVLRPVVQR